MSRNTIFRSWRRNALAAAAVLSFGAGTAVDAQEVIELTAIDGYLPKSMWVKEFIDFYIPEIDRRLAEKGNYKIKWNQAWGGQIVKPKGVLEGLQRGLGDIGVVTTVFHPDKVPLQAVAYMTPFVTTNPDLVARTIDDLAEKYPAMKQAFLDYNQVYLTNLVVRDSYQLFSKTPVEKLSDLKGLKVNGAGPNLRYLEGVGSAGVGGSLVTYYNNLKTGVVDAAIIWPAAAVTFKIAEVAPYMLEANIGTVNSKAITVNADRWNDLPDEVRGVFASAAIAYRDHVSEVAMQRASKSLEAFTAQGGTIVKMSPEARDEWAKGIPPIAKEWAAGLDKKGLPGNEILST